MKCIAVYYAVVNLYLFVLMGIDKYKAIHHKFRIKETTLFLFSALGGGLGGLFGMKLFHHKINKLKFHVIYLFFIVIHSAFIVFMYYKLMYCQSTP